MKEHKGMRSHDIVVLMKMISLGDKHWYHKDLAHQLFISPSEVAESLNRSKISRLINPEKSRVNTQLFRDFLVSGLPVVFPAEPGRITLGFPTAHSAPPLHELIGASEGYVWPSAKGTMRGEAILPLHPKVTEAIQKDAALYELLALADAIRVGRAREKSLAIELLNERINAYQHTN